MIENHSKNTLKIIENQRFGFLSKGNMETNNWLFMGIILLVVVILLVITICDHCHNHSSNRLPHASTPLPTPPPQNKEGFVLTSGPATVSPVTGAIVGQGIMTNQMTRMPLVDLTKKVNSNGFVSDGAISIGVSVGNGFDQLYTNQLDIQDIDNKSVNGYQQREDLADISSKIASSSNNANNNLFTRAGSTPTKLYIAPNEVRCVIDEKYLPERDKNRQIATVGTVIPTQGYDLNIERMGEALLDTHFSSISTNKKHVRKPTAAGATNANSNESPNREAVNDSIELVGNNIKINDSVAQGKDVVINTDDQQQMVTGESFRSKYVNNY